MAQLRDRLTMTSQELDGFLSLIETMMKEVSAAAARAAQESVVPGGQPLGQQPANQQAAQHTSQPTPVTAANLEKQTRALKQAQNRAGGKAGQPPAAPTTTHNPFNFNGVQTSPAGQPIYLSDQRLTQESL